MGKRSSKKAGNGQKRERNRKEIEKREKKKKGMRRVEDRRKEEMEKKKCPFNKK